MIKLMAIMAMATICASLFGGTFSIVGGSMTPATFPTGAYATVPDASNYWQVTYGASASHYFTYPYPDTGSTNTISAPNYTWTVQWVPSYVGEPPPSSPVSAKADVIGYANAWADLYVNYAHGNGSFIAQVASAGTSGLAAAVYGANPYPYDLPGGNHYGGNNSTYEDQLDLDLQTGFFTEVSPGVWQSTITTTLSATVQLYWLNSPNPITYTLVECGGAVACKLRVKSVSGQTVAPDF